MRRLFISLLSVLFSLAFYSVQAQTTAFGETESLMGFARSVAVADGSIFIGEPANLHQSGAVYIYTGSGGEWSEQAMLLPSDGEIGDGFGSALSPEGDRLLVGAPEAGDRGAAYIFERNGDGSWTETARIELSDSTSGIEFGASVALVGDRAFVGAPDEQDGTGAVYLFSRSGNGSWTQESRIANPDTARGNAFGSALAVDGSRLLVGAPQDQGGAVYIFSSDDGGSWSAEATLASNQLEERAGFGSVMSMNGDEVLVSAPGQGSGAGAVFHFQRDEQGSWNSNGRLVAYDGGPGYVFGSSLVFLEGEALIGAPRADGQMGALYRYERDSENGGWSGAEKIDGPERDRGDGFAGTFATDGEIAVAGMTGADYGAGTAAIMERAGDGSWSVATTLIGKGTSSLEPITGSDVECSDGQADRFGCSNMDLVSFLPIGDIGGDRGVRLNDMWGWTDPQSEKEYAIVGRNEGTSFVDVSDPSNPVYVGTLPMTEGARASTWRDIKVYDNHAYVVADNAGEHGMQVVDLTELREFDGSPITLEEVAHYEGIHSAHNVVINEDTGFAYVVGSSGGGNTCGGGLHMVNIQDPANPTFAGCFADPSTGRSGTGYSHDAQCVTYHGPDADYEGREICIGANETAISIADVTDKDSTRAISTASYPDYGYVHQGWLTEDHRYFFQNDELDELAGNVDRTRTLVWDLTDLDDPQFVREYFLDNSASDHNLYIKDNTMYQSNYVSGLQVIDISDPENPVKKGSFDTHPFGEDEPGFSGTWSNFPYFSSGIVVMTSSREGLFILREQQPDL